MPIAANSIQALLSWRTSQHELLIALILRNMVAILLLLLIRLLLLLVPITI